MDSRPPHQSLDLAVQLRRQAQRAESRNLDRLTGGLRVVIRYDEEDEGRPVRMYAVLSFNGGDLRGLMFEGVQTVQVAHEDLYRRERPNRRRISLRRR